MTDKERDLILNSLSAISYTIERISIVLPDFIQDEIKFGLQALNENLNTLQEKDMKYTLKSIKETIVYKANIAAIKALYPNDWKLFARELMIAANNAINEGLYCYVSGDIAKSFHWISSPQGQVCWGKLDREIAKYKKIMGHL